MITSIDQKTIKKKLTRANLPDYWGQYFAYENDSELYELSKNAIIEAIENTRSLTNPFIDSKIIISQILSKFGLRSNFHRQFNERHKDLNREQVLGMQLYKLLVEDRDTWIFHETQHQGHVFPNATYFKQVK